MASNLKYLSEKIDYTTGKVYLAYPHFKEKLKDDYGVKIVFSKENKAEYEKLKSVITDLWKQAKFTRTAHNPLQDGDSKAADMEVDNKNGEYLKGCWYLNTNSKFPITVVNGKKEKLVVDDRDINGYEGRVKFTLVAIDNEGKKSIKLYLKAVQVLREGITIAAGGGDVTSDFDYEEVDNPVAGSEEEETDLPF